VETKGDSRDEEGELLPGLNAIPGVARLAAEAWYQSAAWSLGTTIGAASRIGGLAGSVIGLAGEEAARTVEEAVHPNREKPSSDGRAEKAKSLRERGAELLDRASDVVDERDPLHPGFLRIIDQLAPDEARILKLLINEGPQGIVYVNKAAPFGFGATELARRLSMIGHEAGLLHHELVPAYLDNLVSHGLVAIRRDALANELPYQVIEAQREVVEALSQGNLIFRGQVTRRSVHLTDFGRTFCQVCFPAEHLTGEYPAIDVDGDKIRDLPDVPQPEPVTDPA